MSAKKTAKIPTAKTGKVEHVRTTRKTRVQPIAPQVSSAATRPHAPDSGTPYGLGAPLLGLVGRMGTAAIVQPYEWREIAPGDHSERDRRKLALEGWQIVGTYVHGDGRARYVIQRPMADPLKAFEELERIYAEEDEEARPKAPPFDSRKRPAWNEVVSFGGFEWRRTSHDSDGKPPAPTDVGPDRNYWTRIDPPYYRQD